MSKPVDKAQFKVTWHDHHREPKCAPDPAYPDGVDLDCTAGRVPNCKTELPYPAQRCGYYLVRCRLCSMSLVITTAGRLDDPRSVTMGCIMTNIRPA